jgi:hypothetical protein
MGKGGPWSHEENAEVIAQYEVHGVNWCCYNIPGRSKHAIRCQWKKLTGGTKNVEMEECPMILEAGDWTSYNWLE